MLARHIEHKEIDLDFLIGSSQEMNAANLLAIGFRGVHKSPWLRCNEYAV